MEASCLSNWIVPASLFLLILLLLYLYGTWTFSSFTKRDIPGPKPVPFFGNMLELRKKGIFSALIDWGKQYGKIYGVYFMREPVVLTTDLDIVKEVFLKDFTNFTDRANMIKRASAYPLNLNLVNATGDTWRRLRHTMTPTFSTGKLKLMSPFINRCCENLSQALEDYTDKGQLVDVKRVFGAYTIDVIAGTAFGMETDFLTSENNVFLQAAINIMKKGLRMSWRTTLVSLFPFLMGVFRFLNWTDSPKDDTAIIFHLIDQLIQERKKDGGNGRVDFLKLMLDAEASETEIAAKPQDRQMTKDEIIAQSFTVLLAGYDTTATTLQYMAYLLAVNPDKQEKLYQEIVASIGAAPATYENVMSIKYLDNVVRETLRCFPPAPFVGRKAAETRIIKGVSIPAGTGVGLPICSIMQDEEIFPEPHKFIPERFDNEEMPIIIRELAFGAGPRQCIGMRLALYEAKMAAVTVLRRIKFVKVPETPEMINFQKATILAHPDKVILVGTEVRK